MLKIKLILIALLGVVSLFGQNFADKSYYLIDSLDLGKMSDKDKAMVDSCISFYHKSKEDTTKIKAIKFIIEESWDDNVWPKYNQWLYTHVKEKLNKGNTTPIKKFLMASLASTINNIGYLNSSRGNLTAAIEHYKRSLQIQETLGDIEGAATSLNNIGSICNKQGDIPKALENYHKSLDYYEQINNQNGLAQTLNNIGHIYESQNEFDLALEYFHKSLKIFKKIKHKRGVSTLLNSIGYAYFKKKDNEKAINYYTKSLVIREEINDKKGIASTLNNIASVYENKNNLLKSMEYLQKSIKVYESISYKDGLSVSYNNMGRLYWHLGNNHKAKEYCNKAMVIAREVGLPSSIEHTANTLSKIYQSEGDGMKALEYHKMYIEMRDSILNEETKVIAAKEQAKYEYKIQKAIDDAEYDKVIAIQTKEKEKQKVISIASIVGLLLVVVFLMFVFNRLKITRKQKLVIENQNHEIVDSINYAKRIQDAILPTSEYVEECLPDSFVMYKPKDIVAGDFYWVEKTGDFILFAAADCTGHGVPGAMVSVVCHNALNRAVREYRLKEPAKILDKTREIVIETFQQQGETESILKDGMDIALCSLNVNNNKLEYAGANNSLYIVRSGELLETKSDRQPVGMYREIKPFTNHSIDLNKGDVIYTFTDGYPDQFGGVKEKKFMYKKFKELLIDVSEKPMLDQLSLIDERFNSWKGELDQVDDVCVIGVRV